VVKRCKVNIASTRSNAIENGFAAEFALAQANLIANINAGKGATFRYDNTVPGTSPLPIIFAFSRGNNGTGPNVAANYTSNKLGCF
jgi:hypothetical protein